MSLLQLQIFYSSPSSSSSSCCLIVLVLFCFVLLCLCLFFKCCFFKQKHNYSISVSVCIYLRVCLCYVKVKWHACKCACNSSFSPRSIFRFCCVFLLGSIRLLFLLTLFSLLSSSRYLNMYVDVSLHEQLPKITNFYTSAQCSLIIASNQMQMFLFRHLTSFLNSPISQQSVIYRLFCRSRACHFCFCFLAYKHS